MGQCLATMHLRHTKNSLCEDVEPDSRIPRSAQGWHTGRVNEHQLDVSGGFVVRTPATVPLNITTRVSTQFQN